MFISGNSKQPYWIAVSCMAACCWLTQSAHASQQDSIPWPKADNLTTRVTAAGTPIAGDTIRLDYTLANDNASAQRAQTFVVRTVVNTFHVETPGMQLGWIYMGGVVQDSAAVLWLGGLGASQIVAGDSAAGFSYSAVGVIGIVRYYVRGFVPSPEFDDSVGVRIGRRPRIWNDSYKGWTIAVVPFPTNMTAFGLTARLEDLADMACAEPRFFITEPNICTSPQAKQRLAKQAAQAGNVSAACSHLTALISEVNGLSDAVIKPEGRALLVLNSQHFQRTHC